MQHPRTTKRRPNRAAGLLAPLAAALLWGAAPAAHADEVRFRNGDRLSGEVTEASGGKLKVKTAAAGEVTVDLKEVRTFATDGPVELRLDDGTVLRQRVEASEDAGAVSAGGRAVALSELKSLRTRGPRWTGAVTVGGLLTRGNSNTDSLNVSIEASRRGDRDRIGASAGYIYSRQADPDGPGKTTTADNWFAAGKYDYYFTEKLYGFAGVRAEHDTIAGLDLRLTPAVGAGYQWVERPDLNFSTEAGLAYVYEDYATGGTEEHLAAKLAYHFDTKLNDQVTLVHNLEYLPSLEDLSDFNVVADGGVRASLTKSMFAQLKVEWRYDATPAPDASKNDVRYVLGVGWTF